MLGRRTTLVARKASAHLTRSLLGARSFSSKQRGLYDDDAPVGNMKIETVEVKPESEHAGFSTAHRFNIGSATMPLAKQNEGPSVTGYNHNKALNDENEPPVVIPKHLQYEPARPCDDALLIEEKLRASLARSKGSILGEVVDKLPKVQLKKGYDEEESSWANLGTDYGAKLPTAHSRKPSSSMSTNARRDESPVSFGQAVAQRDREEDTLSILQNSMASDRCRVAKREASYTLDSGAYNFSKSRRSGKLSSDDRFRAAHEYLERKRMLDSVKQEKPADTRQQETISPQGDQSKQTEAPTPKKKTGGWISSFFG